MAGLRSRIFGTPAAAGAQAGEIALRSGYPVAFGMVLVVVSFALSLGYSHFLLQPIDEQALAIMENAVPSLQHLADVRVELAHLGRNVRSLVAAGPANGNPLAASIDTARQRIESEFRQYRSLPPSPEEALWGALVEQRLAQLELATDRVLSTAGGVNAQEVLRDLFEPVLEQTDAAAGTLQRLNETEARANASHILRARHEATVMASLLGSVSLVIAVVATLLVLRILQTRAETTRQYLRLLTERGAELEAFAGRVAHDLRDPLGAVALQVLAVTRRHPLGPEVAPHFNAIDRQLERMHQIIEALLEFARAGAAPAAGARADLTEVLNAVVAGLRPRLETIPVELTIAPLPALEVACTPGALSSVLANLIGNAAKFIVEGSELPRHIAVRVNAEAQAAHVEIEDNGPGIPSEAERRIFEPFQRLASKQPGVGLGLATVKKIVVSYHGRLGVRSRPGKGSVFWFELPQALSAAPGNASL